MSLFMVGGEGSIEKGPMSLSLLFFFGGRPLEVYYKADRLLSDDLILRDKILYFNFNPNRLEGLIFPTDHSLASVKQPLKLILCCFFLFSSRWAIDSGFFPWCNFRSTFWIINTIGQTVLTLISSANWFDLLWKTWLLICVGRCTFSPILILFNCWSGFDGVPPNNHCRSCLD